MTDNTSNNDSPGESLPPTDNRSTAAVLARTARAVELHLAGLDYHAIARQVGYADHSGARLAVLRSIREAAAANVEEARDSAVARCDRMLRHWLPRAVNGDAKAAQIVLGWEERRARLLGLDAPARVTVREEHVEEFLTLIQEQDGTFTITNTEEPHEQDQRSGEGHGDGAGHHE